MAYLTTPRYNPVAAEHNVVKAHLLYANRSWSGRWAGATPCAYCQTNKATDAHHLIFTRAKIQGLCAEKRTAFEHRYNLIEVCQPCHFSNSPTIEKSRDFLIRRVQFDRYGEREVREWVKSMECVAGVTVNMPYHVCNLCQNGANHVCQYKSACDGQKYLELMSCPGCTRPVIDCQQCIEMGEKELELWTSNPPTDNQLQHWKKLRTARHTRRQRCRKRPMGWERSRA